MSEDDVLHRRRVVVIGDSLRRDLFSQLPAIGNEIKLNGVRFTVIGILRKKTQITNYAMPDDLTAFVPLTALSGMIDVRYLSNLVLLPASKACSSSLASPGRTQSTLRMVFLSGELVAAATLTSIQPSRFSSRAAKENKPGWLRPFSAAMFTVRTGLPSTSS